MSGARTPKRTELPRLTDDRPIAIAFEPPPGYSSPCCIKPGPCPCAAVCPLDVIDAMREEGLL